MKRVPTGIEGFDSLIEGGIPEGRTVLLKGHPGTGKSIFAAEFIYNGATKYNEKGAIILTEEDKDLFLENLKESFGWDLKKLEENGEIVIVSISKQEIVESPEISDLFILDYPALLSIIKHLVREKGVKRLVIDSTLFLALQFSDLSVFRRAMVKLHQLLCKLECTTLLISAVIESPEKILFEEHLADGIIEFYTKEEDNHIRYYLKIKKMKATNHSRKIHRYDIVPKKGIIVYP